MRLSGPVTIKLASIDSHVADEADNAGQFHHNVREIARNSDVISRHTPRRSCDPARTVPAWDVRVINLGLISRDRSLPFLRSTRETDRERERERERERKVRMISATRELCRVQG